MKKTWGVFWLIAAYMGFSALYSVYLLPSEEKNALWMGLSRNKLVLCAGIIVLILICLAGAVCSFFDKSDFFSKGRCAGILAYISSLGLIAGEVFLTPPVGKTALERSLSERLQPLAYWGLGFAVLAFLLLLVQKHSDLWNSYRTSGGAYGIGIAFFALGAAVILAGLHTGLGMDPISGTFYRQGVSLLEGQLGLPLLILIPLLPFFILGASGLTANKRLTTILSVLTAVLVWAAAVYCWQTVPFEGRSYFAPALGLPNNNFYPASDAENYDLLAQSVLLGNGFRNGMTVVRPLYAAFLALLHWIFGSDYMQLTNGQILLLALIPVLVFLIGKHLRSAAAGLLAAAWVIWREIYSIRLTPLVQVSNSRLLMSDLPTALLVLGVVLCCVKWCTGKHQSTHALLCGGLIGTAMLLRTQCFVLIPAFWFCILFSKIRGSVKFGSILLSILGAAIVFAPWYTWNSLHPNQTADPDVSEGQYLVSLYRKAVDETDTEAGLAKLIMDHPAASLKAVTAHFFNNEISSLLILPVRGKLPEEADELFYEDDLFWYRANASEAVRQNLPLVLIWLAILSLGITFAFRRTHVAGIAPLVFHLVYNLGNAFALTSGFRFTLPVDWVFLLYFGLGCVSILSFIQTTFLFTPEVSVPLPETVGGRNLAGFIAVCVLLIAVGAVLPICDGFIPGHFAEKDMQTVYNEWREHSANADRILTEHRNDPLVFLEGRAFYPRFYAAGEGDSGGSSSAKRGLDYDRIVWMFHDDSPHVLSCPLLPEQVAEAVKTPLPDPVDVVVAGVQHEDYVEVLEMLRVEPGGAR